jgi:hypothetical protein
VAQYWDDGDDRPGARGRFDYQVVKRVPPPRKGWKPPPSEAEVAAQEEEARKARVKAYLEKVKP